MAAKKANPFAKQNSKDRAKDSTDSTSKSKTKKANPFAKKTGK